MHSNKWETSTQMTLKTGEGITTSESNAHGNPNTWDPSIVFKCLGTREMPIGAYGTQRLHGPTALEGFYSFTSLSLNHTRATIRYMGPRYPHRPCIWPNNGVRPRKKPARNRRGYQLGDHDVSKISAVIIAMERYN